MNIFRLSKYNSILLILSWGIMAIAAKPAISQTLPVASWSESEGVSHQANDLLSPIVSGKHFTKSESAPSFYGGVSLTDLPTQTYQLSQLNQEKFCQDFPENSQCKETTPNIETIPVPALPPAPPATSPDSPEENSQSDIKQKSGWAIVPEISTLGLGGQIVTKIIPQINARVGINAFGMNADVDSEDVEYDGDLDLFNVSTIIDIHPSKSSGFKISGGAVFNNNKIEGTAIAEDTITIGDQEFANNVVESTDVDIEITRNVAPYVGIGWGNAVKDDKGVGFWFNLGVMFGGSPNVKVTPNFAEGATPEEKAQANEAVEEEETEVEDNLAFVSIYPVVSLGISYQF